MDRDPGPIGQPSLSEMTAKAIQVLQKNKYGFFLMVEAGRMDHAHHHNNAVRALDEVLSLEESVKVALELTSSHDTLIVVTADHSHSMSFGGYPKRGNPILGVDAKLSDVDHKPYTTLLYGSGPGYTHTRKGGRYNITGEDTEGPNFIQQTAVPRAWATHGGEDVPVYAPGPMAHLFRGVVEQTHIAHSIAYAACMGQFRYNCSCAASDHHSVKRSYLFARRTSIVGAWLVTSRHVTPCFVFV